MKILAKFYNNRWFHYRKALIYKADSTTTVVSTPLNNKFKIIYPANYDILSAAMGFYNLSSDWRIQFKERLNNGNYNLLVIKCEDDLAYFSWVSFVNESDQYINWQANGTSNSPYLFNCFTIEKFRGNNLHTCATMFLINKYKLSQKELWGIIYSDNHAAIKAWSKAGMKLIGNIKSINFLGIYERVWQC
jgi:hypothetical protein